MAVVDFKCAGDFDGNTLDYSGTGGGGGLSFQTASVTAADAFSLTYSNYSCSCHKFVC